MDGLPVKAVSEFLPRLYRRNPNRTHDYRFLLSVRRWSSSTTAFTPDIITNLSGAGFQFTVSDLLHRFVGLPLLGRQVSPHSPSYASYLEPCNKANWARMDIIITTQMDSM
ncbi:hypothetical protein HPP92_010076 [Vanilla planifolia]|uniref:Uncharacterized protein n=1 Tax=Vanilla planifolia TaxID=51239 RepID=A0A835QWH7_VANPL|nr:hypothetical protein HPP92_010076 [Vanilla planifolia]